MIAESLSEEEIMGLKEMFKSMDTDNSGTITFEELKDGLQKQGSNLAESEVRQLMAAVSVHALLDYFWKKSLFVLCIDRLLFFGMWVELITLAWHVDRLMWMVMAPLTIWSLSRQLCI